MKITSDINEFTYARLKQTQVKNRPPKINSASPRNKSVNPGIIKTISAGNLNERTLVQALSIAQMSRALINKAMIISSRLQNIAAEAITTGRINQPELETAMSEMQSSVVEFGEKITTPAPTPAASAGIPEPAAEIEQFKKITEKMKTGKIPEENVISELKENMNKKNAATNRLIANLQKNLGDIASEYPGLKTDHNRLIDKTSDKIIYDDQTAIAAQGNINSGSVKKLLQA